MDRFANPLAAAERNRQIAELATAISDARQLAIALCYAREGDNEVKALFGRLEALRIEVEQLRRGSGRRCSKKSIRNGLV